MKIKLSIYILIALGTMACHKDKPVPAFEETSDCKGFSKTLPMTTYFTNERFQYKAPHFNPNNSNEFIYHFRDYEQNKFQLVKYSIQTQVKTLIANSGKIHKQPKWSSKGWIAYTHYVNYVDHIYIVKKNGDSLTQITTSPANLNPFWNEDGADLYWTHSPDLGSKWYLMKKSINSLIQDTVSDFWGANSSGLQNNLIIKKINMDGSAFYGYFDLKNSPLTQNDFKPVSNLSGSTGGITWGSSGQFFYVTHLNGIDGGLYRIDLNGNVKCLIKHCDTKRYESISASSDGKYLIGERIDSYLQLNEESNPTGEIVENSSIYLINLQTLEETKIDLSP